MRDLVFGDVIDLRVGDLVFVDVCLLLTVELECDEVVFIVSIFVVNLIVW